MEGVMLAASDGEEEPCMERRIAKTLYCNAHSGCSRRRHFE